MQIVECLGILTLQEAIREEHHRVDLMMMEKEDRLYVTSVTIQDTLQEIAEHLIVIMKKIREGMHMYVSYVITLDIQQDSIERT